MTPPPTARVFNAPPVVSPTPTPTFTPIPTSTPLPSGCLNNSALALDVTVPDGTNLAAGQTFNKIWRVLNNGSCTWGDGYSFTYVGGDGMGASLGMAVPSTAPGATADLLVPMIAPTTSGVHAGYWRLRAPEGANFGETVTVQINVIAPSSAPSISYFAASSATITPGATTTLYWGLVSNADYVSIDNGIGGVATPGSVTVSPWTTTTYTLYAMRGSNTQIAQVTIYVTPASCSGYPSIAYFNPSSATINQGGSVTLYWGLVANANYVTIDNGIGGVATPGSIVVSPWTTTTYTMYAYCGPFQQVAAVTIAVFTPTATFAPTPSATPTQTPTPTSTFTPTPTATSTSTATSTPRPTRIVPPTATATLTRPPTSTQSLTATPLPTSTPSPTPTSTPAPTRILPPTATPTSMSGP